MQRLAQVDHLPAIAVAAERTELGSGACFALGVFGGALVGTAALLALSLAWGAQLGDLGERGLGQLRAAMEPWVGGSAAQAIPQASATAGPQRQAEPLEIFDVAIDRRFKAHAAFGLQLVGAGDRSVRVVLREVPDTAVLSHGIRQNASTWVVGADDLSALHLALAEGTPDAFDIRIDVLAGAGITGLGSVARVRVVDVPGQPAGPAAKIAVAEQVDAVEPAPFTPAAEPQASKAVATARSRGRGREGKSKETAAPQPDVVQRHWPEGANALGAVTPPGERQVWWKMPPPSWSPFQAPDANGLP
jgi:hypothetical protein